MMQRHPIEMLPIVGLLATLGGASRASHVRVAGTSPGVLLVALTCSTGPPTPANPRTKSDELWRQSR